MLVVRFGCHVTEKPLTIAVAPQTTDGRAIPSTETWEERICIANRMVTARWNRSDRWPPVCLIDETAAHRPASGDVCCDCEAVLGVGGCACGCVGGGCDGDAVAVSASGWSGPNV